MKLLSALVVSSLGLVAAKTTTAKQEPALDENIVRILSGKESPPEGGKNNKERDLQFFPRYADDDVCCLDWQYECFGFGGFSKGKGGMMMGRLLMMGSKKGGGGFGAFCEWFCVEECEDPEIIPPPPPRPPMFWPTETYTEPDDLCGCDCQCGEVGAGMHGYGGYHGGYGGYGYGKGFYGKGYYGYGKGRYLKEEGNNNNKKKNVPRGSSGSSGTEQKAPQSSTEVSTNNKERDLRYYNPAPFTCDCSCGCDAPDPPVVIDPPVFIDPPIYYYSKKGKGGMMSGMMGMMGGGGYYYYGGGGMMMGMMGGSRYGYSGIYDDFGGPIFDDYY